MLLIRRAKEPCKGEWCVPGGAQEVGETLQECAMRETREETGISLRWDPASPALAGTELEAPDARRLLYPSVITCVDNMHRDAKGLRYHYTIVEVRGARAWRSACPVGPQGVTQHACRLPR